jgi:KUP system potassium uptake protein
MIVTVCLTLFFGKSDNLAAAYGIAVSATMLMTSALLLIAMREVWGWGLVVSGSIAGAFLCVDASFFLANLVKVADGGYVPLLLASIVYGVMLIWHRGSTTVAQVLSERAIPVNEFMNSVELREIPRVPGTAVFLTRTLSDTPPVVIWHVKHNKSLHNHLFVLRVVIESIPWIKASERLATIEVAPNFWRVTARYGFMERPDIPALLRQAREQGCSLDPDDVTYYVARETIIHRAGGKGLAKWEETLFAAMERNAVHVSDFFSLPRDSVVEIGRQVAI